MGPIYTGAWDLPVVRKSRSRKKQEKRTFRYKRLKERRKKRENYPHKSQNMM